ncbi:MAG TPA: ribose 5-phosphate isomerase B [Acidimicrobiales bacterium]|nr:ribose 5-phosphate isomerase B [Acidimicrobiales bacterium]
MRIAVGSDHAGYDLKVVLAEHLTGAGHQVDDLGTANDQDKVDYPDYGAAVGRAVAGGRTELGVCVCGTGIGISIAANKIPGIRAAVVHDVTTATLAREHNHANVVCLGGRTVGETTAVDALDAFLAAVPQHGRHDRRIEKVAELDRPLAVDPVTAGGAR